MRTMRHWWRKRWIRGAVGAFIGLCIFGFGVSVGNGRVQLLQRAQGENASLPAQLDYSSVSEVYRSLKQQYDGKLTVAQLLDGLKQGLAAATNDPYTVYFNATQAKAFSDELNHSFTGIGAELGKDADGNLIVVSPINGFPAYKAGLKPQDIITAINGQTTSGMSPEVAVDKIRGPKDTKVTLSIVRSMSQNLTVTITRDDIHLPSVTSKILANTTIGYMQISEFSSDTAELAAQTAKDLKQAGATSMILDLRGNPGGLLDAAVAVSSLWLPEGKLVVTEKGTNGQDAYTATGDATLSGLPTVVLIDEGSASASEITAGALHDNNAARLIGTKSYGKGVVQQLVQFRDGSELKVTVASWYRPNGQNINKQGITPDQTVNRNDADLKTGSDSQLSAAQAYLMSHH